MKDTATKICQRLQKHGFQAYFVGGCVRDMLMNIEPHDYDIVTDAIPEEVKVLFENTYPVGEAFGVVCVNENGHTFEVATLRTENGTTDGRHPETVEFSFSLHEDLKRRDFTINAIAMDPISGVIFDPFGGCSDIERRIIKAVGNPVDRFNEDHLRIMRGVRFAAKFRFNYDCETFDAIQSQSYKLKSISAERIQSELRKMLTDKNRHHAFSDMYMFNIFETIMPEIELLAETEQKPEYHPEGNVFIHTWVALRNLPADCGFVTALATMLHDIGKPATVDETLSCRDHDKVGAEIAEQICKRLKMSTAETNSVVHMVKNHMRFYKVKEMKKSKVRALLADTEFDNMMILHKADVAASTRDNSFVEFLEAARAEFGEDNPVMPEPLVMGRDLIEMGFKPSEKFGRVLSAMMELQLENNMDKETAMVIAKKMMELV